jgi:basic membrane protein A
MNVGRRFVVTILVFLLLLGLSACESPQPPASTPVSTEPASIAGTGGVKTAPRSTPTLAPTFTPQPTATPTQVAISTPARRSSSVALVAAVDQLGDTRLTQVREGFERVTAALGVEAFYAPTQRRDTASTVARLAEAGYEYVVLAHAAPDVTEWAAKRYPGTKFIEFGRVPEEVPNLMGVDIADDEAGFLAGALAGWITKSNMVAFVGASPTVEVVKFRKGYEHGVQHVNPQAIVLGAYIGSFDAPDKGEAEALAQLNEGADVLFAVGGDTARGALEAAAGRGVPVIAAQADAFGTNDRLGDYLVSSAVVQADVVMEAAIRAAMENPFPAGTRSFNVGSGTIFLAPFRGWQNKLPERAAAHLEETSAGLLDGSVRTNVEIPLY